MLLVISPYTVLHMFPSTNILIAILAGSFCKCFGKHLLMWLYVGVALFCRRGQMISGIWAKSRRVRPSFVWQFGSQWQISRRYLTEAAAAASASVEYNLVCLGCEVDFVVIKCMYSPCRLSYKSGWLLLSEVHNLCRETLLSEVHYHAVVIASSPRSILLLPSRRRHTR